MTLKKQWNWNLGCSLLLVGVLASAFLFYLWAQNLGKYTLQPEQSISLQVVVSYIMIYVIKLCSNGSEMSWESWLNLITNPTLSPSPM